MYNVLIYCMLLDCWSMYVFENIPDSLLDDDDDSIVGNAMTIINIHVQHKISFSGKCIDHVKFYEVVKLLFLIY